MLEPLAALPPQRVAAEMSKLKTSREVLLRRPIRQRQRLSSRCDAVVPRGDGRCHDTENQEIADAGEQW